MSFRGANIEVGGVGDREKFSYPINITLIVLLADLSHSFLSRIVNERLYTYNGSICIHVHLVHVNQVRDFAFFGTYIK